IDIYCNSITLHVKLHHQDQNTFPTRRSSDLDAHGGIGEVQFLMLDVFPGEHPLKLAGADVALAACAVFVIDRAFQHPRIDFQPADRKSTRLNSSHVAISYAVLCLKKKK